MAGSSSSAPQTASTSPGSAAGWITTLPSSCSDRCVNAEKADSRSISSPKNSARIGSRPVVGNTSTSPPRTEKLPRSSTVSTRS